MPNYFIGLIDTSQTAQISQDSSLFDQRIGLVPLDLQAEIQAASAPAEDALVVWDTDNNRFILFWRHDWENLNGVQYENHPLFGSNHFEYAIDPNLDPRYYLLDSFAIQDAQRIMALLNERIIKD